MLYYGTIIFRVTPRRVGFHVQKFCLSVSFGIQPILGVDYQPQQLDFDLSLSFTEYP